MKYFASVLCLVLLAGCSGVKFDVDNLSVGDLKQAQSIYESCIEGVAEAVEVAVGEAEKAKVASKGVNACVQKYADVLAGLLVSPDKE